MRASIQCVSPCTILASAVQRVQPSSDPWERGTRREGEGEEETSKIIIAFTLDSAVGNNKDSSGY